MIISLILRTDSQRACHTVHIASWEKQDGRKCIKIRGEMGPQHRSDGTVGAVLSAEHKPQRKCVKMDDQVDARLRSEWI